MLKGHAHYDRKGQLRSLEFRVTAQGVTRDMKSLAPEVSPSVLLGDESRVAALEQHLEKAYHDFLQALQFGDHEPQTDEHMVVIEQAVDTTASVFYPNPQLAINKQHQETLPTLPPPTPLSDAAKAQLASIRDAFLYGNA